MNDRKQKRLKLLFKNMVAEYEKAKHKQGWKDNYRNLIIGDWKEVRRQRNLLLEIEELPDGNIKIIIDGAKLKTNARYGYVEINLLDELEAFERIQFPKADTKRVSYLFNVVDSLKTIKQDAEDLINNTGDLKRFLKENGFSSLELPQIKGCLKEMINVLRDKNTSETEKKKIESRLNSFITALTHTNKKPILGKDFSPDEFQNFRHESYQEARKIFRFKKGFCKEYCDKNRACKKCDEIDALTEYLKKRYNPSQVMDIIRLGSPSKYADEMTTRKFKLDRSQYYDYVNRIESLAPQDML
jgi:hypothetical protein